MGWIQIQLHIERLLCLCLCCNLKNTSTKKSFANVNSIRSQFFNPTIEPHIAPWVLGTNYQLPTHSNYLWILERISVTWSPLNVISVAYWYTNIESIEWALNAPGGVTPQECREEKQMAPSSSPATHPCCCCCCPHNRLWALVMLQATDLGDRIQG